MRKYAHIPNRDGNPQTKQDMWDDFVIVALLIVKEKQRDESGDRRKQFGKLAFRKVQM
jgi:hypothetical protein